MGDTVTPFWNLNNPIGTESLGTQPIWNPNNPVGTDTLSSSTINPANAPTLPNWFDRNFGNVSNKDLSDALGKLGSAGKGAGAAGGGAAGATGGPALGAAGKPGQGTGVSLTPLLQLLAKRREDLMNSATSGVGGGQANPAGGQRVMGLLGM